MRKRALAGLLVLLCLFSLSAGGCGKEKEPGKEETGMETAEQKTTEAPADDGVLRILMIGNSFCYYFTDELYGLLNTAGIKATVSNVYASGCPLQRHVNWYREGAEEYEFITYSENGREESKHVGLAQCLDAYEYDVISIQQHFYPALTEDEDATRKTCDPAASELVKIIREHQPRARLFWHETWAYQVGYDRGVDSTIPTVEAQTHQYETIRKTSYRLQEELQLEMIPSGDAWQIARKDERIGDVLCNDSTRNNGLGDNYHDGNVGGGQYLNACVWFEVLTGQSAKGNLFYPDYAITRDKMAALQEAAHEAVEAIRK